MVNIEEWDFKSRAFKIQYIMHFLLAVFFFFFFFFLFPLNNFLAATDLAFLLVPSVSRSPSHTYNGDTSRERPFFHAVSWFSLTAAVKGYASYFPFKLEVGVFGVHLLHH